MTHSTGDSFIDDWVHKQPGASAGTEASIGLTKRIASGYQRLGSRFHPREYSREKTIYVAEFDMAHTPVTVNQYAVFVETGAARQQPWWSQDGWAWVNGGGEGWGRDTRWEPDKWQDQRARQYHPVVGVTFYEAEAYCAWVAAQKKQAVRLPTEAEWERAARGDDGRPFPWGDDFAPTRANTFESENRDTLPVGTTEGDVSPFGLMDMAGNAQEWTTSVYTPLPDEVFPSANLRVARGGSFNDTAYGARTTYRRAYPPDYFYPFLGFRLIVEYH
jgi:formylglycine-generating enzyme required for sulfatase activity